MSRCIKKCTENSFNEKISTYVINCKIHKDRLEKFRRFAEEAGLNTCREICVNGKAFTDSKICKMVTDGVVSKSADMTPIEVAITMSHINVLERFVKSCDDYAIVFEDDSEIRKSFVSNVNKILEKTPDFDMLFLWNGNWMKTKSKLKKITEVSPRLIIMREMSKFNPGAVCYIISKTYAKKLLERAYPIRNPIDLFFGYQTFNKKSKLYTLKMKYDKENQCYLSPLFKGRKWICGGNEGTGKSTQDYTKEKVNEIKCK